MRTQARNAFPPTMTAQPLSRQRPTASRRASTGWRILPVACVLLYALCSTAYAGPRPAWPKAFPDKAAEIADASTLRYTFILPKRHPYCLVEFPSRSPDGSFSESYAVRFGEKWLNFRMVYANDEKVCLLVDATQALGGDTIELYPLGHADAPPTGGSSIRAPQPISCEFRRGRFNSDELPADVLTSTQTGILRRTGPDRFMARNFEAVNAQIRNSRHERRGAPFTDGIADIFTWVYIDQPGTYIFALRGHGASSLAIGPEERIIASSYEPYPFDRRNATPDEPKWTLGTELELQPGIYRLHAQNYHYYDPSVAIGWLRPGAENVEEIPSDFLLSGQAEIPFLRAETRDAPLVVGFRVRLTDPYTFTGQTNVFTTCTATARANLWAQLPENADNTPSFAWSIDGAPFPCTEATLVAILPNGAHDIAVTATMAGFSASSTNTIHIHGLPEHEYRVAADFSGIAPLLRDDDLLRPDLWITGDFDSPLAVDANLTVTLRDGTRRSYDQSTSLVQNWARLEGAPLPVADAASLSWSLRHGGATLASDTLVLCRTPFDTPPVSIVGPTLRLPDGRAVSYVIPRSPDEGAVLRALPDIEAADASFVLLDDFLLPSAPSTNATEALRLAFGDAARLLSSGRLRTDAGEGFSPAALLCGLAAIPEHSTVVLCLGLEDILQRRSPEDYERELVALALLLRDSRHAEVVIASPPPFDGLPVPVRPYAAAALRAAAICGVPAADLYSAFQTNPNADAPASALVDGFRTTPAGLRRAAETIYRSTGR